MISQIITELSQKLIAEDPGNQKLTRYLELRSAPGWEVHQEVLLLVRGLIAEKMLSDKFTELEPLRKDAMQRACSEVDKMVKFLLNPVDRIRKLTAITDHNNKMAGIMDRLKRRSN